ncbi:hypothetical protein NQZ68_030996, partial [Dissostichus eleginoides]
MVLAGGFGAAHTAKGIFIREHNGSDSDDRTEEMIRAPSKTEMGDFKDRWVAAEDVNRAIDKYETPRNAQETTVQMWRGKTGWGDRGVG